MKKALLTAVFAIAFLLAQGIALAQSPPSIPFLAIGKATIEGFPAPDGLQVEALINGVNYAQPSATRFGKYAAVVPEDDSSTPEKEGGVEGDIMTIRIAGQNLEPTLVWSSGEKAVQDYDFDIPGAKPIKQPKAGQTPNIQTRTTGNFVSAAFSGFITTIQSIISFILALI